jgi:hypothetical protein
VIDLANHGVSKTPEKQAYDEDAVAELEKEMRNGAKLDGDSPGRDPTGRRVGVPPPAEVQETIRRTAKDAEQLLSKSRVEAKQVLTHAQLAEAFNLIRASITIAYPMGLPDYDPLLATLDNIEDLEGQQASKDVYDPETACGWFASKELVRGKTLGDIVGKNDKTKIVVKLTKKGSGPPAREQAVDEKTQKEMMAFYYKKAEEHKKLEEDDEDAYVNSPWANPRGLKETFNGTGSISWRPK